MAKIEYRKYGIPTARSVAKIIRRYPDGSQLRRVRRWNCWDEPIGGPGAYYDVRVGLPLPPLRVNYITLEMKLAGCCPESEMKKHIQETADPVVEAYRLHKRGYFGGGG